MCSGVGAYFSAPGTDLLVFLCPSNRDVFTFRASLSHIIQPVKALEFLSADEGNPKT